MFQLAPATVQGISGFGAVTFAIKPSGWVATSVQLRFDVRNSPSLADDVKERLIKLAGSRMTEDGVLIIEAKKYRTQEQNRLDATRRLIALIQKALV